MSQAVIYHNPACGTLRNALAAMREAGLDPEVVEYLKVGWTKPQLAALFASMSVTPRQILRERGTPAAELGLLDGASDDAILTAMTQHPILVERPIVVTAKGAKLCRPVSELDSLLP